MAMIYGLDGVRSGWAAIAMDEPTREVSWRRVARLAELLDESPPPALIAVNAPIGLPDDGVRGCDAEARRLLGKRRHSVFNPPVRAVLSNAVDGNGGAPPESDGRPRGYRTRALWPRIAEVDEVLRQNPVLQDVIREVHPEFSFYHMNGAVPMAHPRNSVEGREERAALLRQHFGDTVDRAVAQQRRLRAGVLNVLNAFAALWTAERIRSGAAVSVPDEAPRDPFGLRMEITA